MNLLRRLKKRTDGSEAIRVAITGAGLMGAGVLRQVNLTPGMRAALVVNRSVDRAVRAFINAGCSGDDVVVSDDLEALERAVGAGHPAVTRRAESLRELPNLDVVVEVTGAVAYGAEVALHAIESGKHIIMMNAETDATVGCVLKRRADQAGKGN